MLKHKMLLPEGILILEPGEPLEAADFDGIAREIDPYIAKHGFLSGLMIHAAAFPGWANLPAFFAHMRMIESHYQKLRRLAVVTDNSFLSELPRFAAHLMETEIKHFPESDYDDALRWLGGHPR